MREAFQRVGGEFQPRLARDLQHRALGIGGHQLGNFGSVERRLGARPARQQDACFLEHLAHRRDLEGGVDIVGGEEIPRVGLVGRIRLAARKHQRAAGEMLAGRLLQDQHLEAVVAVADQDDGRRRQRRRAFLFGRVRHVGLGHRGRSLQATAKRLSSLGGPSLVTRPISIRRTRCESVVRAAAGCRCSGTLA